MININVYKVIDKEDIFMSMFGMEDMIFSADTIHRAFEQFSDEQDFRFNINCDGGLVSEGLRIYDVLRTSGKTLHTNVEGACHSMAVILLLAAPLENRTANPNARALIHEVRGGSWDSLTAEQLRDLADEIEGEQSNILNIYAERTNYDRAELEVIMKQEKVRTASELLKYGFINKINTYSTNKKINKMEKPNKEEVVLAADTFMQKLKNLLNIGQEPEPEPEVVNYEFKDADDVVLFTTEKEDDSLAVGDAATPDGVYTLTDGRVVTITDSVVAEIKEVEVMAEETVNVAELQNQINELKTALQESLNQMTDLRNQVVSTHVPQPRNVVPKGTEKQEKEGFKYNGIKK